MSLSVCQHCAGPVVWSRVPFGRFVHESTGDTTCPPGALLHSLVISATHEVGECPDCDRLRDRLRFVHSETCARFTHGSACVAFAQLPTGR